MTTTPMPVGSLRERVAEEVRVALARRRMSASALARRMGATQSYVWRRMSGDTPWNIDDLEAIARVLGIEPTTLIPHRGDTSRTPEEASSIYTRLRPVALRPAACVGPRSPGRVALPAAA